MPATKLSGPAEVPEDFADDADAVPDAFGDAAVTVTVSAAAGGVHFAVVLMVAVAVSVTDVTDVAFEATGTCAARVTGAVAVTDAIAHDADPFPLAQPLLNVGFSLAGFAVSVTDTSEADPFSVDTRTT